MKTIVIGGVCRAGKSRLANHIFHNTKSTVFHGDHLINILNNNFSDSVKNNFSIVLVKLIKNMGKEFGYTRIFESCHIDPFWSIKKLNSSNYIFLFLGYPKVNVQQKLQEIRDYGKKNSYCWSNQQDDNSMIAWIKHFSKISQEHQEKCQVVNIPYFDTSENFLKVWNQAYDYVMQNLVN